MREERMIVIFRNGHRIGMIRKIEDADVSEKWEAVSDGGQVQGWLSRRMAIRCLEEWDADQVREEKRSDG